MKGGLKASLQFCFQSPGCFFFTPALPCGSKAANLSVLIEAAQVSV